MALNHPRGRFAARKFWFDSRTIQCKIRPTYFITPDRMNDEIRQASEIARDPASVSWATYLMVVALAAWGGIVRALRKTKLGEKSWQQILVIVLVEVITSSFAGVVTFFLCQSKGVPPFYTAVLTSLAGYMGGSVLNILEAIHKARIKD